MKESLNILNIISDIQPRDSGGSDGQSSDQIIFEMCETFNQKLPLILKKDFEVEFNYLDSLEVCLDQECQRFNILIKVMK